jgi:hypothetical protein
MSDFDRKLKRAAVVGVGTGLVTGNARAGVGFGVLSTLFPSGGRRSAGPLRLVSLKPSKSPNKKLTATFSDGRQISFGAQGYSDYTMHHDDQRKERYLKRHKARENWDDLESPGALSRYILWNKKSKKASVADYKRRLSRSK